jgi:NAD-dependent deacetylase
MNDTFVDLLRDAQRILLFTGAGISTGSGIRDFRGPQGVWKTRQPVYLDHFVASDDARVEYWDQKLEAWPSFREAHPNAAHAAAVDLERADKLLLVLTQNIDGLHGKAGTSPDRLVEIHGSNSEVECLSCGERSDPGPHMESFAKTRRPPVCACGGFLKPATISFGQSLRGDDLHRAARAAEACDLVVALGSSLSVHPAASFPLTAAERGVPYVIVNRGPTDQDTHPVVTLRLEGDVVAIFPPAVAAALGDSSPPA